MIIMRKLLTILMLFLTINGFSQSSINNNYLTTTVTSTTMSTNVNLRLNLNSGFGSGYGYNNDTKVGPYLVLGGASFVLAGLLTRPVYEGGSTTLKKPFYEQPRSWVMITGGIIGTVGLVFTISGN